MEKAVPVVLPVGGGVVDLGPGGRLVTEKYVIGFGGRVGGGLCGFAMEILEKKQNGVIVGFDHNNSHISQIQSCKD